MRTGKGKDTLYKISGTLILVAAATYAFAPLVAPWIMAFAVSAFTAVTATNPYPGKSMRGKRLFNFQILSCLFMVAATYLMFRGRNEWVLAMIVGAVFLLYAAVVMPRELDRENKENNLR